VKNVGMGLGPEEARETKLAMGLCGLDTVAEEATLAGLGKRRDSAHGQGMGEGRLQALETRAPGSRIG
jgi:hypothetical protein